MTPTTAVIRVPVEVKNAADLPKLDEGLRRLSKSDSTVLTGTLEDGKRFIAGSTEEHLETCLKALEADHAGVPLVTGHPIIQYYETVQGESTQTALSKSKNKHNRLFMKAEPIDAELSRAVDEGKVSHRDDIKARAKVLSDDFGWDVTDARKIWSFGPENSGPNVLVDATKPVQFLQEVRSSIVTAFQEVTQKGVLIEEPLRSVRFNLLDLTLHKDVANRDSDQITPTARRVMYASFLCAQPGLMEPVYLVNVEVTGDTPSGVYALFNKRRGQVFSAEEGPTNSIKAYLPVAESFGFHTDLRQSSSGRASATMVFDHWELVPGSALEPGTPAGKVVADIRKRKGLAIEVPKFSEVSLTQYARSMSLSLSDHPASQFYDKL